MPDRYYYKGLWGVESENVTMNVKLLFLNNDNTYKQEMFPPRE